MKWLRQNKLGFTLIEFMIVLAIIGILAALLFGQLHKYENKQGVAPIEQVDDRLRNLP